MREQIDKFNYFFVIASEKPVSHEARQITELPPGKHVATKLGCSNIFWNNIVNIERPEEGEGLLLEMS